MITSMAARVSSPMLIGRSSELRRLRSTLALTADGRSSATLIAGEAGVGKTRLVAELASRPGARPPATSSCAAAASSWAKARCRTRPSSRRCGAWSVARPCRGMDAILGLGSLRAGAARAGPRAGRGGTRPRSQPSPRPRAGCSSCCWASWSGSLRGRPSCSSSRTFTGRTARRATCWASSSATCAMPRCMLADHLPFGRAASTPSAAAVPGRARANRAGRAHRAPALRPRASSAAQLRAIAGHDLDAALVESIHARSGGNAFFAEELLAAGRRGRPGRSAADAARRAARARRRPGRTDARSSCGWRPRPGSEWTRRSWPTAADMDETALYDALRECVGARSSSPDPTGGVERYAFRHALLQEAVYDDLLPGERTRLHCGVRPHARGAAPGRRRPRRPPSWPTTGTPPTTCHGRSKRRSARREAAESRYAFAEAQAQYERADRAVGPRARMRGRGPGATGWSCWRRPRGVARFHEPARAVGRASSRPSVWSTRPTRPGPRRACSTSASGAMPGSPVRASSPRRRTGRRCGSSRRTRHPRRAPGPSPGSPRS